MTDRTPSDEAISAHLDGAATPEEAAAVEASAPARARRDELEAVRAAVGEPVIPPAGARDAAVAAALAVYDREVAPPADPPRLDEHRARRRPRRPVLPALAAAASVAFVLAVALAVVRQPGETANMTAAGGTAAETAEDRVTGRPEPTGTPGVPPPAGPQEDLAAVPSGRSAADESRTAAFLDLGRVSDGADLGRLVAGALAGVAPAPANVFGSGTPPVDPQACERAHRAARADLGPLVLVGRALYRDQPAEVHAYRAAPGAPVRAFLSEPGTCRVLLVDPG